MVVALALAAALFYGAADFCGGLAARRSSALAVVAWSQAVGLLVLLVALVVVPGVARPSDVAWGLACGAAGAFAIGLLYRGLAIGVMGVVSPITAVLAAAIPVAFAFVRGDRPAALAVAGIAFALVAVVLVSASPPRSRAADDALARPSRRRSFPPGMLEALGAGTAFGFFFIALAQTHADAGLYPLLATRVTSLVLIFGTAFVLRKPLRIVPRGRRTVVVAGALDMGANVAYVVAVHIGALSIVAVVTSLYPAATVALAAFVLHERLVRVQWAGVAVALAGLVCIALAR